MSGMASWSTSLVGDVCFFGLLLLAVGDANSTTGGEGDRSLAWRGRFSLTWNVDELSVCKFL